MIAIDGLIWMPHAGHFILGNRCCFRLATYVPNGYIISTVGELQMPGDANDAPFHPLGAVQDSLYETMVFPAQRSGIGCCPYTPADWTEIDGRRYGTADEATAGHHAMIEKWAKAAAPVLGTQGDAP